MKEREEKTSDVGEPRAAVFPADEFNRVIIPVKRGEENTDYVNASFIDVSALCVPGAGPCRAPRPSAWEGYL